MWPRVVLGLVGFLVCVPWGWGADVPYLPTLDSLKIKYQRDDKQRIIAVELPNSARDYHLEAVLDNPELVKTVQEIRAPAPRISFERMQELKNLPVLSAVSLEGSKDANDYVACLRGARHLRNLSLAGSSLTNHGLLDLCSGLPELVALDLTGTKIDSLGLAPLAKLENLETLRLGRIQQGMSPSGSTQDEQAEDRRGFRYIANLPRLKRVIVEGLDVTTDDLLILACNCYLEELNIGYPYDLKTDTSTLIYVQECQPSILFGPHIARSIFGYYQVNGNDWIRGLPECTPAQLRRIPKPQLVYLAQLEISQATSLDFLKWLPRLKRLTLRKPALGPEQLIGIKDAPTVEIISISGAKIDLATVKLLLSIRSIKQVTFSTCDIEAAASALLDKNAVGGRIRISP